jgi:hypothetical protein
MSKGAIISILTSTSVKILTFLCFIITLTNNREVVLSLFHNGIIRQGIIDISQFLFPVGKGTSISKSTHPLLLKVSAQGCLILLLIQFGWRVFVGWIVHWLGGKVKVRVRVWNVHWLDKILNGVAILVHLGDLIDWNHHGLGDHLLVHLYRHL